MRTDRPERGPLQQPSRSDGVGVVRAILLPDLHEAPDVVALEEDGGEELLGPRSPRTPSAGQEAERPRELRLELVGEARDVPGG